jgi:hypothetical protein
LIDLGSELMIPFPEFSLGNTTYPTHAFDAEMFNESTQIREAAVIFYRRPIVKIVESLHAKGMRILSTLGHGLSLETVDMFQKAGFQCLSNLPSARAEFSPITCILDADFPLHLANRSLSDIVSTSSHIRRYRALFWDTFVETASRVRHWTSSSILDVHVLIL